MITKARALTFALAVAGLTVLPASAQQVRQDAVSKARWYNAPREIQITDDRPVVKDFREGPSNPNMINLPPGPGAGGGYGGGGAGALGAGDPSSVLPSGGLPIGGGGPGYRTDNGGPGIPLQKADFNHAQTNIPARGMAPRNFLPSGQTTGIHGRVSPFATASPVAASPAAGRSYARPQAAPQAATYNPGGGYGPSVGNGSAYGSGGANTSVSAKLLKKIK